MDVEEVRRVPKPNPPFEHPPSQNFNRIPQRGVSLGGGSGRGGGKGGEGRPERW